MTEAEQVRRSRWTRIKDAFLWEPGADEKVPPLYWFKHRYVRAVVYLVMCAACTLIYYGWQQFSQMLFRHGAYRWKCDEAELLGRDDYCTDQYNRVQSLYTVGLSCESIFGVVAGLCLDHAGPWFTGVIGCAMFFSGWMCFIYNKAPADAYIPGMVLLAGSVNMIAFPCLSIGDFFPKWEGLYISLVVATQNACTMVAPILKAIWDNHPEWDFGSIMWGYLLIVFVPLMCLYLLCLPWKRVTKLREKQQAAEKEKQKEVVQDEAVEEEAYTTAVDRKESTSAVVEVQETVAKKPYTFLQQVVSPEYLVFAVYYILQVMAYGYYPTTVLDEYGEDVSNFQGWSMPSQAVWGALIGLIVDKVLTVPICVALTASMTLAMGLALIRNTSLQYVTTVLYVVSNSYIYTVKYTYVAQLYPTTHFGVLVGGMGCVAGLITLINVPIQNANKYTGTCIAFIAVGFVCFACLGFCWWRYKKGYNYLGGVEIQGDKAPEKQNDDHHSTISNKEP